MNNRTNVQTEVITADSNERLTGRSGSPRIGIAITVLVAALVVTTTVAFAADANPGIAPPNSNPYGASYGEWSARWWQWIFSIPARQPNGLPNPLFTDGAVDCSFSQSTHEGSDHVWFLAGKICVNNKCGSVTTARRSCTVPSGTALFFPMLNGEADNVGFFPPLTLDQLKALATSFGEAAELHASITGVALHDLFAYRASVAPFAYKLPTDDNFWKFFGLNVPGSDWPSLTVTPAASDGYFLMVEPLPPGSYSINFGGAAKNSTFQLDITYDIKVVPRGQF